MKKIVVQRPSSCAFVNNGKYLAVTSQNSDDVSLFDTSAVKPIHEFGYTKYQISLIGHFDKANCVVDDGKNYIATGAKDKTVCIWSRKNHTLIKKLQKHTGSVVALAFSPKNSDLASASFDGTVCIWRDFSLLYQFRDHDRGVTCVNYSPNGRFLATGSNDGKFCIYQTEKNYLNIVKLTCGGHIRRLSFSNNSKFLAISFLHGHKIEIYDTNSFELFQSINGTDGVFSLVYFNLIVAEDSMFTNWILDEDETKLVKKSEGKKIDGLTTLCAAAQNGTSFAALTHNSVVFWQFNFKTVFNIQCMYMLSKIGIAPYVVLDIMNYITANTEKISIQSEEKWFHYHKVKVLEHLRNFLLKK